MSKPTFAAAGTLADAPRAQAASVPWAIASLALSMLLSSLGTSIANVALPSLAQAFSASFQDVQWVVLAYLLVITSLIVGVGRLGDIVGRRLLLLTGIAVYTAASLLCGAAPTLGWLVAARALQGLGAAIMMTLAMAMVGESVPKERTGSAMGLLGTMSAVGTALGPSLGGILIAGLGWRAIFLVNLPLGLAALVLAARALPSGRGRASPNPGGFDVAGTVVLAATLAAYALAMTVGQGRLGALNMGLLLAAALGLGLFLRVEARASSPLVRLAMFRDRTLCAGLAAGVLVMTVMMATLVVGPFYLSRGLGLATASVGLVMSLGPVVSTLSGVPAGRLVDWLGAPRAVMLGLLAMAAGALALCLLPALFGLAGYVAAILVLTPGYQLFQAANNTAVMMDVRQDQRGVVSGLLNLSRNLGLITGASAMGAAFALAAGTSDPGRADPAAVAAGMQTAFAVATVLVLGALVFVALAKRRRG